MSIICRLGGIGSGKSLCAVRDLIVNNNGLKTYTNIQTKKIKNVYQFKPEMIIKRDVVSIAKNGTIKYKFSVNVDFWKNQKTGVNIVIDEFHNFSDSRKSMSNINKTVNDWIAMLRRVIGESSDSGGGTFTIITQLERRVDTVLKELTSLVLYHICNYSIICNNCGYNYNESSDSPERYGFCNKCLSNNIKKYGHTVQIYYFQGFQPFYQWYYRGDKTYFRIKVLKGLNKYFENYDTTQWDNLFADYY